MIDQIGAWKSVWTTLPPDATGTTWANNLANYLSQRVTMKLQFASPVFGQLSFTFNAGAFAGAAAGAQGGAGLAGAWQSAVMSSICVASTAYIGSPAPPTLFAGPPVIAIIATAGYSRLLSDLQSMPLATTMAESRVPDAFFNAFSLIQLSLTGVNSVPPPVGPQPLTAIAKII